MFSPHLQTTSPWSSVIPTLQRHPLNFVPASLAGGVDIQLTSDYGILFYNATTTTDTTTTAPSKDYTELLARIDRILHSSTPQLTIFYLGDNPWNLQLKVHETFTESVTVLPLGRVEDIPSMLVEMARSCAETRRYLQQRAGEDKVRAEWLLGCMGLSEHGMWDVFLGGNEC